MYSLLLLSSLIHITTCTVYTVTPDDHYYPNTTCHHCHNLQHYLLNITKYFTSNTQLLFLPGLHHLHTDLIILNVHNISLIGSAADNYSTTLKATIQGNLSAISMFNISKLTISNIIINISYGYNAEMLYYLPEWIPLTIKDCSFVLLYNLQVHQIISSELTVYMFALRAINIMGNSNFNHVKSYNGEIYIVYNNNISTHIDREHHSLLMNNCTVKEINLNMLQDSYRVTLRMANMQVQHNIYQQYRRFMNAKELGRNEILIINCQFVSNSYLSYMFLFTSSSNGSLRFTDCRFINNSIIQQNEESFKFPQKVLIKLGNVNVEFNNCSFHNSEVIILQTMGKELNPVNAIIKNSNYSNTDMKTRAISESFNSFISLSHTTLILVDSVSFYNITNFDNIISLTGNSAVIISRSGTVKFSHNHVDVLIDIYDNNIQYIIIKENSILNISDNKVMVFFQTKRPIIFPYPFCFFQYFTILMSEVKMKKRNFLIRFYNNLCSDLNWHYIPTTNCHWSPKSSYHNMLPLDVNNYYIQFINNTNNCKLLHVTKQHSLCVCTNELHYDCHINDLGYLYAGQTLTMQLHRRHYKVTTANTVVVKTDIDQQYSTPCIVLGSSENI